jgi:hypothetical protein
MNNKRSTNSSWKANSVYSNSHFINPINTQVTRCQNLSIIFFSTLAVKQNEHNCKRDPTYSEYRLLL